MTLEGDDYVEDNLRLCDEMLEMIDELPERAIEWGMGIQSTIEGIRADIDAKDRVTDKQLQALDNIYQALCKWSR